MMEEVSEEKGITAARLSQSVERLTPEREVPGSIPGTRFKITWDQAQFERFLYILSNSYR